MATLNIEIPDHQFRHQVVKAVESEPTESILELITDLVEEIAGDDNASQILTDLVEHIKIYILEEV